MMGFYVSIMFIGILLILSSLILIAYEKKKEFDGEIMLDDKKKTLERMIVEAEEMIEELNKLSDYILSQFEQKKQEVIDTIDKADKKVKLIKEDTDDIGKSQIKAFKTNAFTSQNIEHKDINSKIVSNNKLHNAQKVITLNKKHEEVVELFKKGFNETQIAKKLGKGKGEIQLILGMTRQLL